MRCGTRNLFEFVGDISLQEGQSTFISVNQNGVYYAGTSEISASSCHRIRNDLLSAEVQSSHEGTHRNLIKSNRNQNAFSIFRLICNQTDVRLVPNQSKNGKYNLISVWFNKIYLCVAIWKATNLTMRGPQRETSKGQSKRGRCSVVNPLSVFHLKWIFWTAHKDTLSSQI